MKTTIYYFTGTGNSLSVAKKIANALENTEVKSIKKMIKEGEFSSKSENIGIVFPVISWGAPFIVDEFIRQFKFRKNQYIFSVATCGATPAGTNTLINKMLKKKALLLSAGYTLNSKAYKISDAPDITPIKLAKFLAGKSRSKIKGIDQRLNDIVYNTRNRKIQKLEGSNLITNLYGNLLHDQVIKVFKTESKNFWVDDNYRKKLSRARNELEHFMKGNCSLVDINNKCKCSRKTKAAIELGDVDPKKLQFANQHLDKIKDKVKNNNISVEDIIILRIQALYRDNPFQIFESEVFDELMNII